jgi:phosphoglycerate dehydrogenase-like enzyme
MRKVNVVVTSVIGEDCYKLISGVSPSLEVNDISDLFRQELKGEITSGEKVSAYLAKAEVVFGLRLPKNILARSPKLRWIQVMSAGVEHFLDADMRSSRVKLTNVSGIHAVPMGEFVLGLMLMFTKQSVTCMELKNEKKWTRLTPGVLKSKTVGIIGLGSIGREIARLAGAFQMKVIATSRSAGKFSRAQNVDSLLPAERLPELLQLSDFVVLSVPFTTETEKLIGEKELRMMKPTAFLINIARGGIIHEPSLVKALQEHWIAGAGLDVFATEPLPNNSPLWDIPNVIFSPHISGVRQDYALAATHVFIDNLQRYLEKRRLRNVVNKKRGY